MIIYHRFYKFLLKKVSRWDDLFSFLENITSLACLFRSGLKHIFHWLSHWLSDIFCRSSFSSFTEMLLSFTTDDESSTKKFTVDSKLSNKSLTWIRKKSDLRIKPCDTPALTGNDSNVWSFSNSLSLWNIILLSKRNFHRKKETFF